MSVLRLVINIIGLVDYDLLSGNLKVPNVEIMKLASYYKTEEGRFCRLLRLEEEELSSYHKIFFFSEKENHDIPLAFKKSNNVIYGGTGFTQKIYKPFENELIDYTVPSPILYKEYLREKINDKSMSYKQVNDFLDNTYHRMYAQEKKLIVPPMVKRKKIFLYDRNFFWNNWEKDIEELIEREPSSINRIHPIWCDSIDKLLSVKKINKILASTEIALDLPIKIFEADKVIKNYEKYLLQFINFSSGVYLPIGQKCKTVLQYYSNMIFTLNLLYFFWARKIPIKIKFIEPELGINCPIKELLSTIENWSVLEETKARDISLEERLNSRVKKEARKQYETFLKFHSNDKSLFKKSYNELQKGGFWHL